MADVHPNVPDPGGLHAYGDLIALGSELEALMDRLARRVGNVTLSQFRVLDALRAHDPAPLEPLEIGRLLTLGSNHVTMLLDALEARGLVVRAPHPTDGRRRLVRATPDGLNGAERLARHVAALEERILGAALGPAEREHMRALAGRVRAELARMVVPDVQSRPGP